jgi:signal transduction histidine kinase
MMQNTHQRKSFLELMVPWPILALVAVFTYASFVMVPHVGFEFTNQVIVDIYVSSSPDSLQVGDRLLVVDGVDMDAFYDDLSLGLLENVHPGDTISILIERNGEKYKVDWLVPGMTRESLLERIAGIWWLPFVFWAAGTVTLLFIRPKDSRWRLLIAFNYLNAIWIAVGNATSRWHIWSGGLILGVVVWLCLPVYIHLHWEYPKPIKQLPRIIWIAFYILAGMLSIAEWFQWIPISAYYAYYSGFAAAVLGSIILLIVRWWVQKDDRHDIMLLGSALILTLLPPSLVSLVYALGLDPPLAISGGSILALPALPGAYFLVAYRRQFKVLAGRMRWLTRLYLGFVVGGTLIVTLLSILYARGGSIESTTFATINLTLIAAISAISGFSPFLVLPALSGESLLLGQGHGDIEIRANRVLSLFLYFVLMGGTLAIGIVVANALIEIPGKSFFIGFGASIFGIVVTALGYLPFQRFVDRSVLGAKVRPEDILIHYSDRITTSLNQEKLAALLSDELLPSILVRQSVLLKTESDGWRPFLSVGVEAVQIPKDADILVLEDYAGKLLIATDEGLPAYPWIRLILPLFVGGERIGFWLFGRRDPDDFYSHSEIKFLGTLASQTAIALTNIDQAKRLRTLYQSDIDRQEEERRALARTLHDNVLNRLAALPFHTGSIESQEFVDLYFQLTSSIRQVITSLRPAMLEYGLWTALDEFVDELNDRSPDDIEISLEVPKSKSRYAPKIEQNLYQIIQESCENALRHSDATAIQVSGSLDADKVRLEVVDDGIGIELEQLDFSTLLTSKHFGLAGMFERANVIGANVRINSTNGDGTRVIVDWVSTDEAGT